MDNFWEIFKMHQLAKGQGEGTDVTTQDLPFAFCAWSKYYFKVKFTLTYYKEKKSKFKTKIFSR